MSDEIVALENNQTWKLVKPPHNSEVIDCRWVYKVKNCADGKVKYKARLTARGFSHKYGVNYWETYAPVVKSSTVRLFASPSS